MNYKPIIDPETIRPYYSKSLKNDIVLLTAHSHQAWPDKIEEAQKQAAALAFEKVDQKWGKVFGEIIPLFNKLVASRIGTDKPELIANGENTHDLLIKVLSCFKWDSSFNIVTTDSEFYSLKRQLYRLKEEGVNITFVSTKEKDSLTERIISSIDETTDIVITSSVFFNDGFRLQNVAAIAEQSRRNGALFVLDAYHHFNTRVLNSDLIGRDIFITAGGYKYAQAGEGAAWLKIPENCNLRPAITGWFSDYSSLEEEVYPEPVRYGKDASRFLGATRDISGICRQIAVFQFMDNLGMTVEKLEQNNIIQTNYIISLYDDFGINAYNLNLLSSRSPVERGAFIAFDTGSLKRAELTANKLLNEFNVLTDTRGRILRICPAPYTTGQEILYGMESLKKVLIRI